MRVVTKVLLAAMAALLLCRAVHGDTIVLKDGRVVEGEITRETESAVTIRMKLGEATFNREDIKSIEHGPVEESEEEKENDQTEPKPRLKTEKEAVATVRRYIAEKSEEARAGLARSLQMTFEADPELVEKAARQYRKFTTRRSGHIKGQLEVNGEKTEYALYVPEKYDLKKSWPLIVALHGRSGNGPAYVRLWHVPVKGKLPRDQVIKYQQAEVRGYIVVAPTAQKEWNWGPSEKADEHLLKLIAHIRDKYNVDPDRIYVHGLSMGGAGTWILGLHYADRFAGIEPRAGLYGMRFMENVKNLPVYITHGDKDETVPVKVSRDAAAKLKELKYDYIYSEIPGGGHQFFIDENQKVLDYFDKKKRNLYPKEIRWIADKPEHGRAYWLDIDEFKFPGYARLDASCDKESNSIEIKTDNVKKLKIYLSRQMVDFDKPVIIKVNDKEKHNGIVKPSISTLLEILRTTGDEGRLFSASLTIDIE